MKVKFAIKAAAISSENVLTLPPVASGDIGGRAADIGGRGRFYAIHDQPQCADSGLWNICVLYLGEPCGTLCVFNEPYLAGRISAASEP
jgi:hypothetical protein